LDKRAGAWCLGHRDTRQDVAARALTSLRITLLLNDDVERLQ